jgi:hypothetical protein
MTYTKYTKEQIQEAVSASISIAGVLRYLGIAAAGGNHSHMKTRIEKFNIDTSHFRGQGWSKDRASNNRKTSNQILIILPKGSSRVKASQLRRALIESGRLEVCEECSTGNIYNGKSLVLEIDHINGDWLNNLPNNLRFLCPNCHSQQDTGKPWKNARLV